MAGDRRADRGDLVEDTVVVGGRAVGVLRPRDSEALLDEEAFEREERLPYWAELWPSARILADRVARRALRGARVLELGCGLGLVAMAAALAGGRVLATDWSTEALEFAARNAERNGLDLEVALCDWRAPQTVTGRAPWDLVLASDVLYERRNVGPLVDLLPGLTGARGEAWIADPGRRPAEIFLAEAADRGWEVTTREASRSPLVYVHEVRRLGV